MSFLNWRPIIYNGDLSVCVHYGARPTQTGAVSEVRPADTEVCVFSNEITGLQMFLVMKMCVGDLGG